MHCSAVGNLVSALLCGVGEMYNKSWPIGSCLSSIWGWISPFPYLHIPPRMAGIICKFLILNEARAYIDVKQEGCQRACACVVDTIG